MCILSFFSFFSFHKFIARFFEILVFGVNFAVERARRHQLSEINFAISVEKCSRAPARSPASDDQEMQLWTLVSVAIARLARLLFSLRRSPGTAAPGELRASSAKQHILRMHIFQVNRNVYCYLVLSKYIVLLHVYIYDSEIYYLAVKTSYHAPGS